LSQSEKINRPIAIHARFDNSLTDNKFCRKTLYEQPTGLSNTTPNATLLIGLKDNLIKDRIEVIYSNTNMSGCHKGVHFEQQF
jgi:hypothetical protein